MKWAVVGVEIHLLNGLGSKRTVQNAIQCTHFCCQTNGSEPYIAHVNVSEISERFGTVLNGS